MRFHGNFTSTDLDTAARIAGVTFHSRTEHGSRSRTRAWNVRLEGSGGRTNTGMYGAGDYNGATWDEWGAFIAALYAIDPDMHTTAYASRDAFHWQTGDRFRTPGVPANTHPRHRWGVSEPSMTGTYRVTTCTKCGAITRRARSAADLATILEN